MYNEQERVQLEKLEMKSTHPSHCGTEDPVSLQPCCLSKGLHRVVVNNSHNTVHVALTVNMFLLYLALCKL